MTCIALACVDFWGRRKFLLSGATLMAVGILILGLITKFQDFLLKPYQCKEILDCIKSNLNNSQLANGLNSSITTTLVGNTTAVVSEMTTTEPITPIEGAMLVKIVSLLALMLYVAAFAFSFGPGELILLIFYPF